MWPNPQETADLVKFTEEILNAKLYFFVQCKRDDPLRLSSIGSCFFTWFFNLSVIGHCLLVFVLNICYFKLNILISQILINFS